MDSLVTCWRSHHAEGRCHLDIGSWESLWRRGGLGTVGSWLDSENLDSEQFLSEFGVSQRRRIGALAQCGARCSRPTVISCILILDCCDMTDIVGHQENKTKRVVMPCISPIFVSYGYPNRVSQTGGLKATEWLLSWFWRREV